MGNGNDGVSRDPNEGKVVANEGDEADEAAEALIGLVGMAGDNGARGAMDEDEQTGGVAAGGGAGGAAGEGSKMGPGRVVWAKVEGHDWWPARVVRRRAVPREVS